MFTDFRDRGREREREKNRDVGEKHRLVAFRICPNWGLNPQHFDVWDDQPTEPLGQGSHSFF